MVGSADPGQIAVIWLSRVEVTVDPWGFPLITASRRGEQELSVGGANLA